MCVWARRNLAANCFGCKLPDLTVGPAMRVLRPNLPVLVRNPVVPSPLHEHIPLLRPLCSGYLPSSRRPHLPNNTS